MKNSHGLHTLVSPRNSIFTRGGLCVACLVAGTSLLLAGCGQDGAGETSSPSSQRKMRVPAPAVVPDALVSIAIPDLHGFLDAVGSMASVISPEMDVKQMTRGMGAMLQDPELSGIPKGKGCAVVLYDAKTVFALVEVDAEHAASYKAAVAPMNMLAEVQGDVLIVAQTPASLQKGKDASDAVQQALLSNRTTAARVALAPAAAIEKFEQQLQGMMQMLPMLMGGAMQQQTGGDAAAAQKMMKLLQAELKVMLSLAKQVQAVELVYLPGPEVLEFQKIVAPVDGSNLGKLLSAPRTWKAHPALQPGLLEPSTFALEFELGNMAALTQFFAEETKKACEALNASEETTKAFSDMMSNWAGVLGGTVYEYISFSKEEGMLLDYLMDVQDEGAALELFAAIPEQMKTSGFMDLYKEMGMPMTMAFAENVREYKGTPVHQYSMKMTMASVPEEQKAMMEMFTEMTLDIAFVDGVMAYSHGTERMNGLVDTLNDGPSSGSTLKAREGFAPGGSFYGDVDMGGYMNLVASFLPENMPGAPSPETFSKVFEGVSPITMASHTTDGRLQFSLRIPMDIFVAFGKLTAAQ